MKNYHLTFIVITIGIFLLLAHYIFEHIIIESDSKSEETTSKTSSSNLGQLISLSTVKNPTNPENPKPNHKSYQITPFKIVENTVDTKCVVVKPLVIVKQESKYVKPQDFVLEQVYDKFYNFVISEFTNYELYNIKNAHIIFEPSDLIRRKSQFPLKSILYDQDIKDVSKVVQYLSHQNNNNVGAYIPISSLEKDREDVNVLRLQKDIDYCTGNKRILMSGEEYLPIGPTSRYESFIQYRLSQVKRCGFDFVQLGVIDPISIINFNVPDVEINSKINLEEFRKFVFRLLKYCQELELKVCISDFPALFNTFERELADYIHYVHVFNIDARSFKKPTECFIKEFSGKPVFLSTVLCNDVIDNFIYNTGWPIESVLYEMSIFGTHLPVPELPIKTLPKIKWCPYPKRWWKGVTVDLPPENVLTPNVNNKMLHPVITNIKNNN